MSTQSPPRIFLLSIPRTTSNLFMRLFAQSPEQITQNEYLFMWGAMWGPQRFIIPSKSLPGSVKEELSEQYKEHGLKERVDELERFVREAESEGKIVMIKEHTQNISNPALDTTSPSRQGVIVIPPVFDSKLDIPPSHDSETPTPQPWLITEELDSSNPTYLPSRLLASFTPTFIIRHPALILPSFKRASAAVGMTTDDPEFSTMIDFQFSRRLFDWYCRLYTSNPSASRTAPIVIDADDLVLDTQGLMGRYCAALGLDERKVLKYEWEKKAGEQSVLNKAFLGTLDGSSGVIRDESKTRAPDLEKECISWVKDHGEESAGVMKKLVEENMENYEYLKRFKL